MTLLDGRGGGRFLSEAVPLEFPQLGVSPEEVALWELYYKNKKLSTE